MRKAFITGVLGTCLAAATGAQAAVLQYGYDFTTGDVTSQGNLVNDDSGSGFHAASKVGSGGGNGGTYSADVPAADLRQFTTGVGSVNTTAGTHQTTSNNIINNSQILAAGGLTFEAWIKPNAAFTNGELKQVISESGVINLTVDPAGNNVFFRVSRPPAGGAAGNPSPGGNVTSPNAPLVKDVWTHVAGVLSDVTAGVAHANGDRIDGTLNIYVNGELKGSTAATNIVTGFEYPLTRATAIGNHPTVVTQNFQGLIFEPRVSLGALDPSQFTVVVPEPGSLAALGCAAAAMLLRRKRLV